MCSYDDTRIARLSGLTGTGLTGKGACGTGIEATTPGIHGGPRASTAPMSQATPPSRLPSRGLDKPRWSEAGGGNVPSFTACVAVLPLTSACVKVPPPLFARLLFKTPASGCLGESRLCRRVKLPRLALPLWPKMLNLAAVRGELHAPGIAEDSLQRYDRPGCDA